MEQFGSPRFLGSPLVPLPCSRDPGRATLTTATKQGWSRPRHIQHKGRDTNHLFEVGSHSFGARCLRFQLWFPYTGKTRFRSGGSPYRVGFEPTGLQRRISIRLRFACYSIAPGFAWRQDVRCSMFFIFAVAPYLSAVSHAPGQAL